MNSTPTLNSEINQVVEMLKRGSTICYPTDTIWGIGCDATNSEAVDKIYKIKGRDTSKSMLILVDSIEALNNYVKHIPEIAANLIKTATEPLTIIFYGAQNLAHNLYANDGTIGVRVVNHAFCTPMLQKFGKPIVSTSANISGQPPPSLRNEIDSKIIESVDYTVYFDNEQASRKASRIILLTLDDEIKFIR